MKTDKDILKFNNANEFNQQTCGCKVEFYIDEIGKQFPKGSLCYKKKYCNEHWKEQNKK